MKPEKAKEVILVCEDLRSRWNVGSIFRTAEAFGVSKIYLCGITPRPPHQEISKVALGAEQWVRWGERAAAWELVRELKEQGCLAVALEKNDHGVRLSDFEPKYPLVLVVGQERRGISKETLAVCDQIVQIPMVGRKESLNVAVAAGIALWALMRM